MWDAWCACSGITESTVPGRLDGCAAFALAAEDTTADATPCKLIELALLGLRKFSSPGRTMEYDGVEESGDFKAGEDLLCMCSTLLLDLSVLEAGPDEPWYPAPLEECACPCGVDDSLPLLLPSEAPGSLNNDDVEGDCGGGL